MLWPFQTAVPWDMWSVSKVFCRFKLMKDVILVVVSTTIIYFSINPVIIVEDKMSLGNNKVKSKMGQII